MTSTLFALDQNGDGYDDFWALAYTAAGLAPAADTDGDGASNAAEAIAGTNPRSVVSFVRVDDIALPAANQVRLRWPSVPGKRYRVQASGDLATWSAVGVPLVASAAQSEVTLGTDTPIVGTGATLSRWTSITSGGLGAVRTRVTSGTTPNFTGNVDLLDVPQSVPALNQFGQWLRGWIVAPATGDYTFWIASDDQSELWLSTDASAANRRLVAQVAGWTNYREWNRNSAQHSATIALQAGRAYYFEAIHYDASSSDHVSIGWSGAALGSDTPTPITSEYLSSTGQSLAQIGSGRLFFRLQVDDVDSDTDGLTDYDERLLGYDPGNPTTTPRVPDLEAAIAALASRSTITVGTNQARAYEAGAAPAQIKLFRTGGVGPLLVRYTVAGTATSGSDYTALTGSVVIPVGAKEAVFDITPLTDALVEPPESVTVTLRADAAYDIGAPAQVTATIDDAPDVLYVAQLRAPIDLRSGGYGTAAVRTAGNQLTGVVWLNFGNITAPQVDTELFVSDDGAAGPAVLTLPAGQVPTRPWEVVAAGGLTRAQILTALSEGRVWARVRSSAAPVSGELRGRLVVAPGWDTMPTPPVASASPATAANDGEAARFLIQSTFGPDAVSIARVRALGFSGWVDEQLALPATYHLPYYQARRAQLQARDGNDGYWGPRQEAWWQHALTAPDQLRQRMAFALSELLVISQDSSLSGDNEGVTVYYDMLLRHAFGNYRQLLEDVTLSPMMGQYLSMIRNRKPDPESGHEPDENFAREIMQLFSFGLSELHPDGTLRLGADGMPIPTYTQADIVGLAHVFTGWGPHFDPAHPPRWGNGELADEEGWFIWGWDSLQPMTHFAPEGDQQARRIAGGVTVPGTLTGPQRLALALDTLFNRPSTGPFVAKQLIQRFVTSNPSPGYVYRVASKFNDNGSGGRGDLGAVIRAILLDPEARRSEPLGDYAFGKPIEPLLRMSRLLRAYPPPIATRPIPGDPRFFIHFVWEMEEQSPLMSPSVFNFFRPAFSQPGLISAAGLMSPEFQILSETTSIYQANRQFGLLYWGIWSNEPVPAGTSMDLDFAEPLAVLTAAGQTHAQRQAALINHYDVRLLGGRMSPFLRQEIQTAFNSLPTWIGHDTAGELNRARLALYLVLVSPEFATQR
ncbi:MAG: DUF1800 family protein [Opitutaceae bacterium]|nr:DUF1800 family protein [Opitutaceae bacterium]